MGHDDRGGTCRDTSVHLVPRGHPIGRLHQSQGPVTSGLAIDNGRIVRIEQDLIQMELNACESWDTGGLNQLVTIAVEFDDVVTGRTDEIGRRVDAVYIGESPNLGRERRDPLPVPASVA